VSFTDFTFLDKKEYGDIILLDESHMDTDPNNDKVYIRKYVPVDTDINLHRHKYIQINYVASGGGFHYINDKGIGIEKGDIFVIPPYVPHAIVKHEGRDLEIFEFEFSTKFILPAGESIEDTGSYMDFAYLEPFIVIEEAVKPKFNLSEKLQHRIEEILYEALCEFKEKRSGYLLIIKALLLKLLVITGRAYSDEIKGTEFEKLFIGYKSVVTDAVSYINENYSRDIKLRDAADAVGYSRSRFSYLFKSVLGQTFVEYLTKVRINKAAELLSDGGMSITDISYAVGFNTISNFNKAFKAVMGETPRAYRKNR